MFAVIDVFTQEVIFRGTEPECSDWKDYYDMRYGGAEIVELELNFNVEG